jgi:hypothetical protein
MSRRSPFEVRLSVEDRAILEERASSRTAAHVEVVRTRIVLLAADDERNTTSRSPPKHPGHAKMGR